jgi:FtsP/CotA-like multicopper oxidase with cupredoxin domain
LAWQLFEDLRSLQPPEVNPTFHYEFYTGGKVSRYLNVLLHGFLVQEKDWSQRAALRTSNHRPFMHAQHMHSRTAQQCVLPQVERGGVMYTEFGVNRRVEDLTVVQHRLKLGDVEEWRITMYRSDGQPPIVNHPYHQHVNHFQVGIRRRLIEV